MKNLYRVQMMTTGDYHAYMCGSDNYSMETVEIIAETPKQATDAAILNYPDMVINERYVEILEEDLDNPDAEAERLKAKRIATLKAKRDKVAADIEGMKQYLAKLDAQIAEYSLH